MSGDELVLPVMLEVIHVPKCHVNQVMLSQNNLFFFGSDVEIARPDSVRYSDEPTDFWKILGKTRKLRLIGRF